VDFNQLLTAAPHLQSIATTIVAGVPLGEIVKRIVLPSADVLGKRMADRVERCFGKTAKMIDDAGVTPQPVEDKLVVEILRGASLEDNEELHTMWAALLANASSPEKADKVRPVFLEILKAMSPDEAWLIAWICEKDRDAHNDPLDLSRITEGFESLVGTKVTSDSVQLNLCLTVLESQRLIDRDHHLYFPTTLATVFLEACRPPKPKE